MALREALAGPDAPAFNSPHHAALVAMRAHFMLPECYLRGLGVTCDAPAGLALLHAAAAAGRDGLPGMGIICWELSLCYAHGVGVAAEDPARADEWRSRALAAGLPLSDMNRVLGERMRWKLFS